MEAGLKAPEQCPQQVDVLHVRTPMANDPRHFSFEHELVAPGVHLQLLCNALAARIAVARRARVQAAPENY